MKSRKSEEEEEEEGKLTGPPVKGDFLPLHASTHAGMRIEVAVVPV
jgi:hypothetical protein